MLITKIGFHCKFTKKIPFLQVFQPLFYDSRPFLCFFTLKILPFCLQNAVFYFQNAVFITFKARKRAKKVEDEWRITPFSGHLPLT